jgi:hypothetical protein
MRLTERHLPCRFPAYPTRFRRSREEGDFAKGRGRTNTEAGNRGHQDQRHRGSSRRIARHRFGKAFQVSAGTSAIRQPRRVRVWSLHNSRPRSRRAADKRGNRGASSPHSFDHLVGAGEQHGRDFEAKSFRGFEVDRQDHLGWELFRQVARSNAPQDFVYEERAAVIAPGAAFARCPISFIARFRRLTELACQPLRRNAEAYPISAMARPAAQSWHHRANRMDKPQYIGRSPQGHLRTLDSQ